MQRKYMFAGLLLLASTLASNGAMADLNDRSASALSQSAPAAQESNADSDERFLALFRAASLSLTQAIAVAERLHAGSRTAAITFDISGTPAYRVRTIKNKQIWENVIDVVTGRAAGPEIACSLNELEVDERDNLIALRSIGQELSDAVAIAEKAAAGKAISGGMIKEKDQVNFVVVVLSDDRVKEVFLEPPRSPSNTRPNTTR
jgi:Peptidase propeptide and YPEB domain